MLNCIQKLGYDYYGDAIKLILGEKGLKRELKYINNKINTNVQEQLTCSLRKDINDYLLKIVDIYDKFSSAKVISKNKMESLGISEYLMGKYAAKETKSQYREIDNEGLIRELCSKIENKPLSITEQIKFETEYLDIGDGIAISRRK